MCGKPPTPKPIQEKPPQYLRNPFLDGLSIGGVGGIRSGRNALRVDLGTPGAAPSYLGVPTYRPAPQPPVGAYGVPGQFAALPTRAFAGLVAARMK